VDEFYGRTLAISQIYQRKGRTDENLRGDFAKFHGPSDLGEVQGRYSDVFPKGSKLRRGRAIDQDHKDRGIYTYIVYRGFVD
jgi:hypothetical protein